MIRRSKVTARSTFTTGINKWEDNLPPRFNNQMKKQSSLQNRYMRRGNACDSATSVGNNTNQGIVRNSVQWKFY
jgi:hypothetical protein